MSLRTNIFSGYLSQIYVTLIGILTMPVFLRYMGVEAFGLVGFFTMLQAWFQMLDLGLSPTIVRQTSRYSAGSSAQKLRELLRAMEIIFLVIAIIGGSLIIAGAHNIAISWLKLQNISVQDAKISIMLIGGIIAFRWMSGLYRGVIYGFENILWLSYFNSLVATLRFLIVILIFIYIGSGPIVFFAYQLLIAIIELSILFLKSQSLMPKDESLVKKIITFKEVIGDLKFSLIVAFTGSIWVLVTQTDKLILSKLLTLSGYSYFTLATLAAGGILMITTPITSAILPRLSKSALNDEEGLIRQYREATQLVALIAIPAGLILSLFSDKILWVWTGDEQVVLNTSYILTLYALGNTILAISAFPYYLQFAKGNLRLHLIGSIIFLIILIPSLLYLTHNYGVIGSGYSWLLSNIIYFLFWVPVVHNSFYKNLHFNWIFKDIAFIGITSFIFCILSKLLIVWPQSRIIDGILIAILSFASLIISALSSSFVRKKLIRYI